MEYYYQSQDTYFPSIRLIDNKLEIKGESYMENPTQFYYPIMKLIESYFNANNNLTLNLKLGYVNTSSLKCISQIINLVKEFDSIINWYYDEYDIDMIEEIEDLELDLNVKINKYENK